MLPNQFFKFGILWIRQDFHDRIYVIGWSNGKYRTVCIKGYSSTYNEHDILIHFA